MAPRMIALLLPALTLTGCISYHSSPQPLVSGPPVCMYAGEPYSPGAKIFPPSSPALVCRGDGSWSPG